MDQRRRGLHEVQRVRGVELLPVVPDRLAEPVRVELVDLEVVAVARQTQAELDAVRRREGVLELSGRRGDEDPQPLEADVRADLVGREGVAAEQVGDAAGSDHPVPAVAEVGVGDLAADVLEGALRLEREQKHLVAEHVREVGGRGPADVVAVVVGADADLGLADVVERQRRGVVLGVRGPPGIAGHETRLRVRQVRLDPAEAIGVRRGQAASGLAPRVVRHDHRGRRVVDRGRVDVELELVEHRVGERSVPGHRHGRRHVREAADRGREVGVPADVSRLQADLVDVREAVLVRDEVQAAAVRGVLRIHVLDVAEDRQHADLARGDVDQADLELAVGQELEVGLRAPVRGEGDRLPVGRPGGLQVGELVVGEPRRLLGLEVVDEEVADAADRAREGEVPSVGRPRGVRDRADLLEAEPVGDAPVVGVDDDDLVVAAGEGHVGELAGVRRPRAGGVDVAKGVDVLVGVGAGELADDPAGLDLRHEEVDREEVLLRQEGDVAAVGAERR